MLKHPLTPTHALYMPIRERAPWWNFHCLIFFCNRSMFWVHSCLCSRLLEEMSHSLCFILLCSSAEVFPALFPCNITIIMMSVLWQGHSRLFFVYLFQLTQGLCIVHTQQNVNFNESFFLQLQSHRHIQDMQGSFSLFFYIHGIVQKMRPKITWDLSWVRACRLSNPGTATDFQ